MRIDIVHPGYLSVQPSDLHSKGLGGNETALVLAARGLAARGHEVRVFADCRRVEDQGARWHPLPSLRKEEYRDVIMFWVRTKRVEPGSFNAPVRVAKLGLKTPNDSLLDQVLNDEVNVLIAFSDFQRHLYLDNFGYPETANWVVTADGLDISHYARRLPKVPGRFLHAANPKRGLEPLLDMWPTIRRAYPGAELFVASSHLLRGITADEDERRAGDLYRRAASMSADGVRFLGRVAKPDLIELQLTAQFYLYPTTYPETCCIAALEAAAAGDVIVCSPAGALPDRVVDGVTGFLIDGDPADPSVAGRFADRIALLREDPSRLERMGQAARDLAGTHDYAHVLPIWEKAFARAMRSARTRPVES
ncbi:glycosyltransferase [Micromonospora aurantiaca]|uniref:glycosyltransferase family 4 protein n=1 Tax=Micromonospora aurantiaca (nom. illeg.) TaxID=47850 RepID=UPI000F3D337D|nr:glycosyltransferase family 4 protein [Micromonospora aurantiaca]RNH98270.1 glycosyltransferase [Micromonospora aurantiaca]